MTARMAVNWHFHSYSTGFNCFEGRSINTQALRTKILCYIGLTIIDKKKYNKLKGTLIPHIFLNLRCLVLHVNFKV